MKKIITAFFIMAGSYLLQAQVGVNTQTPKATFDVVAKKTDGTTAEGVIAPRLTGDQIIAAEAHYGADQTGAIVYATAPVTTPTLATTNITQAGYYYFDGSAWQAMTAASALISGTPFVLSGTTTDAEDNKTDAIGRAGIVGIGTTTPNTGAVLDITSTDKGFLIPRVADTGAVSTPVNGMMIYDLSSKCFKFYENGAWTDCLSASSKQTVKADCTAVGSGFQSCYYANVALSGATYKVTLVNNTFQSVTISGFTTANLVISGVSGVTVASVSPASVTIAAGASAVVTFNLSGTPASTGTLVGTFTKGILTCSNSIGVNASPSITIASSPANIPVGCVYPMGSPNSGVTWTSSNTTVATINSSTGQLTAKAAGTTTITAMICGGTTATRTVTVVAKTFDTATAGSSTLTIPAGITHFTAEAYGAGGGGAGSWYQYIGNSLPHYYGPGKGGGGGAYSSKLYTVAPGFNFISYTVGLRGAWGNFFLYGSYGGNSYVLYNSALITAGGGAGGCTGNSTVCNVGSAGGVATGGDTNINGSSTSASNSCGGAGAGPLGGNAQCLNADNNGYNGNSTGGGGAGSNISGASNTYFGERRGGNGANGRVIITWQCPL